MLSIDAAHVTQQLEACDEVDEASDLVDADAMTLSQLADQIEATHHAYLREELPRLDLMTEKVSRVHDDKDARLIQMRDAFVALKAELEPHMMKEEQVLFPIIRQMEAASGRLEIDCRNVSNPIREMEHEHEHAGNAWVILNQTTDGYTPPDWSCNTYRAMLDSLEKLEANMHQHVHKENNVLFVKAMEMEEGKNCA